jgi:hypothetical protein
LAKTNYQTAIPSAANDIVTIPTSVETSWIEVKRKLIEIGFCVNFRQSSINFLVDLQ